MISWFRRRWRDVAMIVVFCGALMMAAEPPFKYAGFVIMILAVLWPIIEGAIERCRTKRKK